MNWCPFEPREHKVQQHREEAHMAGEQIEGALALLDAMQERTTTLEVLGLVKSSGRASHSSGRPVDPPMTAECQVVRTTKGQSDMRLHEA